MTDVIFAVLAVTAVVAAWRVFVTDSMIRAAFFLLASFVAVAGTLLLLASDFLGGIMVLMMTGEMVIMAVFMVMFMMNPAGLMPMTMVHNKRFSLGASVATFVALTAMVLATDWPVHSTRLPGDVTYAVGQAMMEEKMLVFLAGGVVLLACMIAGLGLALHRGRYDRYGDDLGRDVPVDPIPAGLMPKPGQKVVS